MFLFSRMTNLRADAVNGPEVAPSALLNRHN